VNVECLADMLACPVCLEPQGCTACVAASREQTACDERYAERVRCACGGPDKVRLVRAADGFACPCCRAQYSLREGVLDLTPRTALGEGTLYADHDFHERLEVTDNPLLLSACIKARQMRRSRARE
jgi:uncharacterized protein YbaR (Trm112 family)